MFDSSKEAFISVMVGVITIIYSTLVIYMMRRTRYLEIFRNLFDLASPSEKAIKFYEMLMKGLKNDLINNIDDVTYPHLLYHYELECPALINPSFTGMPVKNFPPSCLTNSSGVRYPNELCGLSLL